MPSSRARAFPTALVTDAASMHAWYALRDELLDRIDNVEDLLGVSNRRLEGTEDRMETVRASAARAEQINAATVADVRKLVAATTKLDGRFVTFENMLRELRSDDPEALYASFEQRMAGRFLDRVSREQVAFVDTVKKMLADSRLDSEASIRALSGTRSELEERNKLLTTELREVQHQISDLRVSVKQIETETKASIDSLRAEVRELIHASSKETVRSLESKIDSRTGDQLWRRVDERVASACRDVSISVDGIAERILHRCAALDERQATVVEGLESFGERVGELQNVIEDTTTFIKAFEKRHEDQVSNLQRDTAHLKSGIQSLTEELEVFRESTSSRAEAVRQHVDTSIRQIHATLADHESQHKNAIQSLRVVLDETVRVQIEALVNDIAAVQRDFDSRHKRLVESTHQAIDRLAISGSETPTMLANIKHELNNVRETLAVQATTIERDRVDGHALAKIKDWLQDLERRAASKVELEQIAAALSASVASSRDAAQNSEAVLAQRVEAERSAREYEFTSIRSLLQRLQTSGRIVASP